MKAYYSTSYGGSEVSFFGDFPAPVAGKGQLLIETKAVSINPVDFKVKRGIAKFFTRSKFPRIYGSDFAGIVKETGSDVAGFKPGDRVYGVTPVIWGKQGALAELMPVDQKYARMIPSYMTFEEAASLPIAALTALNGLRRIGVKQGTQVLINGATGGVGHFAVQIAKAKGAVVTATCSAGNADLAKKLGADYVMGYKREELTSSSKKYEAIMDAYGKMLLSDILKLLDRKGCYATTQIKPLLMLSSVSIQILTGRKITSSNLRSQAVDMDEMEKLFAEKKIVPLIENYFTLDKAGDAFDLAESGKVRGKIIVRI